MKMPSVLILLPLLSLTLLACGDSCQNPVGDNSPVQVLYFTSFETESDIEGWVGLEIGNLLEDPAPGSGGRSVLVGGGCVQPAAYIVLEARERDADYSLSCWGKLTDDSQPGAVVLATGAPGGERTGCGITVESENWRFYRSENQINCPAGRELRIEVYIGGIIGASMKVDGLTVESTGPEIQP